MIVCEFYDIYIFKVINNIMTNGVNNFANTYINDELVEQFSLYVQKPIKEY